MTKTSEQTGFEIAVIGMSGRFPGAKNIDEFWSNIRNGIESIKRMTDKELRESNIAESLIKDPYYIRAKGTIEDYEYFDAQFFDYTPREAEYIDPQQRLFLEGCWEALEKAGYDANQYAGHIGVYGGANLSSYLINNILNHEKSTHSNGLDYMTGNCVDFLSTRVSYKFNLTGPSMSITTACSTSLVLIHQACQALLAGDCDIALAGGVRISLPMNAGYYYVEKGIMSADGTCRAFDENANGTVAGNGIGILVLKRLAEAIQENDNILAVIKGSAINNDGSNKVGFTAPSVEGQSEVVKKAIAMADINPETITYVEAHATGTSLGDPIEIQALNQAYSTYTKKEKFCAIGSVKTNIGHLDSASGVVGLIKTVCALKNKELPPSLHFKKSNPQINFEHSPFFVNTELKKWDSESDPRRAGVSSFGLGGTNAHLILEEYIADQNQDPGQPAQLLTFSAKTKTALQQNSQNFKDWLEKNPGQNFADMAYTLKIGRKAMKYRTFMVCQDREQALSMLAAKKMPAPIKQDLDTKLSCFFMFSGQGSQYVKMAADLYENEPFFRRQIEECCEIIEQIKPLNLLETLYPGTEQIEDKQQQLMQTAMTQPALFMIEYALAKLLMKWGIQPKAFIGHSIGEYVAACLAGVFSLRDALKMVVHRGHIMQSMPGGSMLAIPLPEEEIKQYLNANISLATINNPRVCVLAGETESIDNLKNRLEKEGTTCYPLHTSHAFHSHMMDGCLQEYAQIVNSVSLNAPQIPFISNLNGEWIKAEEATSVQYWVNQLRQPVRFCDGIKTMLAEKSIALIEIGPGQTLANLTRQHPACDSQQLVLSTLPPPKSPQPAFKSLLNTIGQMWQNGITINWHEFYASENRCRIELPTYPFQKNKYWISSTQSSQEVKDLEKKQPFENWFYLPCWHQIAYPQASASEQNQTKNCLIFSDENGIGRNLKTSLETKGYSVCLVRQGKKFMIGQDYITLKIDEKEHYELLFKHFIEHNIQLHTMIHLWNLSNKIDPLPQLIEKSYYNFLEIVKAMNATGIDQAIKFLILSNRIHKITGFEKIIPERAMLTGPCKVIPLEYLNMQCKSIDIELPENKKLTAGQYEQINQTVFKELFSDYQEQLIAYRNQIRYTVQYDRIPMANVFEQKIEPKILKKNGVYLITGGHGGMGLTFAEYLLKNYQAKIILLTRSKLPPAAEWENWLAAHDQFNRTSAKIKQLKKIAQFNEQVLTLEGELTDPKRIQGLIKKAESLWGEINGVIHTAGVSGGAAIQRRTREDSNRLFQAKLFGTKVLENIFKDKNLDFFINCSSLAAVIGPLGQVGYTAVNTYQDMMAHNLWHKSKTKYLSINWDSWLEVGMAIQAAQETQTINGKSFLDRIKHGLLAEEGIKILLAGLYFDYPQLIITTRDIQYFFDWKNQTQQLENTDDDDFDESEVEKGYGRPELDNEYIAPRTENEKIITRIWEKLLGINGIGLNDNFFDLGGNSLTAIQIITNIRKNFKTVLPVAELYEKPTVAKLATKIPSAGEQEAIESAVDNQNRQIEEI